MRRLIETVLKDGTTVILEDDTRGTYELARWSAQEGTWLAQDGKPYEGTPTHWHALHRADPLVGECNCSDPLQTSSPNLGAEPKPALASANTLARPPEEASSALLRFVGCLDKPIPQARPAEARRRFAAFCGAAMVAASLTGMYFRGDVAAYADKHARSDEFAIGSLPQGSPLEQPRIISLSRTPKDAASVLGSAGQVTVGEAPTQSSENRRPTDATENDLFNLRQALAEAQERESQLKQTADKAKTELQQSQDRIAALEAELARARQQINPAPRSSRRSRHVRQRRLKNPNPEGFFGIGG